MQLARRDGDGKAATWLRDALSNEIEKVSAELGHKSKAVLASYEKHVKDAAEKDMEEEEELCAKMKKDLEKIDDFDEGLQYIKKMKKEHGLPRPVFNTKEGWDELLAWFFSEKHPGKADEKQ
jgi:hypothetical protein